MSNETSEATEESVTLRSSRDKSEYMDQLAAWLKAKLPGCETLEILDASSPGGTGSSSELILLDLKWQGAGETHEEGLVIRLEPQQGILLPDVDFSRQFELPRAVGVSGTVPVANMRFFEPSSEIFGTPFFVMDRIDGVAAADVPPYNAAGWLAEAEPEFREKVWWNTIQTMADLHAIDVDNKIYDPFKYADTARGEMEREIAYYESLYNWGRGDKRYSLVEDGLAYVKANLQDEEAYRLCWGDARMGNMMFDPKSGDCLAVLDWEMYSFGVPEKDIAYWINSDRFFSEGFGVPRLPGWPSYDETIAEYQRMTGYELKNMHYYEVFGMLRNLIIYIRLVSIFEQSGRTHAQIPSVEDVFTSKWLDHLLNG